MACGYFLILFFWSSLCGNFCLSDPLFDENYATSLIDIVNIELNITGNFDAQNSALFYLNLMFVTDSEPPKTYTFINSTEPVIANNIHFKVPENLTASLAAPHAIIDIYAISVFNYINSSTPGQVVNQNITTKILELRSNNYTQTLTYNLIRINQNNDTIHGLISFQYLKRCSSANTYGFNCLSCSQSGGVDGTCYTCDPINGTRTCCPDYYYYPYCFNGSYTTTLDPYHETTTTNNYKKMRDLYFWIMIGLIVLAALIFVVLLIFCCMYSSSKNKNVALERQLVKQDAQKKPQQMVIHHPHLAANPESRLPPYRPPQTSTVAVFPRESSFHPVQPLFPRTSPHHSRTNSRHVPLTTARRYPSESTDDWSYEIGQEHVV